MKKRVLIIYASYGSGHKMVANYIKEYFKLKNNYDVYLMNIMDYANVLGKTSEKMFDLNIKYSCRNTFTFFYELFNNKVTTLPYQTVFRRLFHISALENEIEGIYPDVIIATHFFGVTIGSICKRKGIINSKIVSVLTDYCSHELWEKNNKDIDYYIVSDEKLKTNLIKKGISKNKIYAYGIPISSKFSKSVDLKYVKEKYKLTNNKKTILFFAGGSLGSNLSYKYLRKLVNCNFDINIIFVSGNNVKLEKKCLSFVKSNKIKNVKVLGFITEVNELLSIADIVVTKPGGISITECLKMNKKMILLPGNGGQEIFNAKYICKSNNGVYASSPEKLCTYIKESVIDGYKLFDEEVMNNLKGSSMSQLYKLIDKEMERV